MDTKILILPAPITNKKSIPHLLDPVFVVVYCGGGGSISAAEDFMEVVAATTAD